MLEYLCLNIKFTISNLYYECFFNHQSGHIFNTNKVLIV
jgi:hypothetical protein